MCFLPFVDKYYLLAFCKIIQNIVYTNCYQIINMTLPTLCDLGDMISR